MLFYLKHNNSIIKSNNREKEGFTLIELLVTIAILAVLATAATLIINPAELVRQGRDSTRLSDMKNLDSALGLYMADARSASGFGQDKTVYTSLPDSNSNCSSYNLPDLPSGWSYNCVEENNLENVNGTGWVPINFTNTSFSSPLSVLPVDPVNSAEDGLYYTYLTGNSYALVSKLESERYLSSTAKEHGEFDESRFVTGSSIDLWEEAYNSTYVIGEAGSVEGSSGEWVQVNFDEEYTDPVIVGARNTQNGSDGIIVESRNVNSGSAEIRICSIKYDPAGDGCRNDSTDERMGYLVIDAYEVSDVDGIDAGTFSASGEIGSNDETVNFTENFSSDPYVFATVQDVNGPSPVEARILSVSQTSLEGGICQMDSNNEDDCGSHSTEKVGWIAIDSDNAPFVQTAELGQFDTGGNDWESISFSNNFSGSPIIQIEVEGYDGTQDVIVGEAKNITSDNFDGRFCEFDYHGACDSHNVNPVSWIALQSGKLTFD